MPAFSRLRRRFSNKPNVIQTRQGTERLPFKSFHPHWIVGRGLCMYRSEDFGNVPRNKRRAALDLKLPLWSPFANTGHHCVWEGGKAMVWFWDADAVPAVPPPGRPPHAPSPRRRLFENAAPHPPGDGLPAPRVRWRAPAGVPRRLRAAALARTRAGARLLVPATSGPDAYRERPCPMGRRHRSAATGGARPPEPPRRMQDGGSTAQDLTHEPWSSSPTPQEWLEATSARWPPPCFSSSS